MLASDGIYWQASRTGHCLEKSAENEHNSSFKSKQTDGSSVPKERKKLRHIRQVRKAFQN